MWVCVWNGSCQHVSSGAADREVQSFRIARSTESAPEEARKEARTGPRGLEKAPDRAQNPDHDPGQLEGAPSSLFGALRARGPAPQEGPREPQEAQDEAQDGPQRARDGVQKAVGRVDGTSLDEKAEISFPPKREHDF